MPSILRDRWMWNVCSANLTHACIHAILPSSVPPYLHVLPDAAVETVFGAHVGKLYDGPGVDFVAKVGGCVCGMQNEWGV